MRELYPVQSQINCGFLKVSKLHSIYYEEVGNQHGKPVVFLHGGPGGGIDSIYSRYFNPSKWRVVLFDQRGAGKSTPSGELNENTTSDLLEDIEKLRTHLNIESWTVFGGSWGSSLALAYSQKYPERCTGLILRGIFLLRKCELDWIYREGANWIFPDAWEDFCKPIPLEERSDMLRAYYKRLTSDNRDIRLEAARSWARWEAVLSKLTPDRDMIEHFQQDEIAEPFARIACHYLINGGFLEDENQLIREIHRIRHIPAILVQGRYDIICPIKNAWELHQSWPAAKFVVVPEAGHSITEVGIRTALLDATDMFAEQ